MALADLAAIRSKARKLSQTPSDDMLTDQQLDNYINTFLLYNFPSELRLFSTRRLLNFYTQPGQDVYKTLTDPALVNDPLFNFQNIYITTHPQVYMAGVAAYFTQYRDIFYGLWPQTNAIVNTGQQGNGTTGPFTGVIPAFTPAPAFPIANNPNITKKSVNFNCLDANGTAMILVDYPVDNVLGALGELGVPQTIPSPFGQINYQSGAYSVTFPFATATAVSGSPNPLWVEYLPFIAGKPTTMLFYNNEFTLRPVPNQVYQIQLEVDVRPTALLNPADVPQLEQWWQYIAYGAAMLIVEDRVDDVTQSKLAVGMRKEFNNVNRTSLIQTANMSTKTVFNTPMRNGNWNGYNWPM